MAGPSRQEGLPHRHVPLGRQPRRPGAVDRALPLAARTVRAVQGDICSETPAHGPTRSRGRDGCRASGGRRGLRHRTGHQGRLATSTPSGGGRCEGFGCRPGPDRGLYRTSRIAQATGTCAASCLDLTTPTWRLCTASTRTGRVARLLLSSASATGRRSRVPRAGEAEVLRS